jgi:hypothetical protein
MMLLCVRRCDPGAADLKFLLLATRSPAVVEYGGSDACKTAHYMVRWLSRRGPGARRRVRRWGCSEGSLHDSGATVSVAPIFLCVPSLSLAHSGRTDTAGGHYNRRTGEYHFHHGMGPHQHPGGVCPFSGGSTGSNHSTRSNGTNPIWYVGGAACVAYAVYSFRKSKV